MPLARKITLVVTGNVPKEGVGTNLILIRLALLASIAYAMVVLVIVYMVLLMVVLHMKPALRTVISIFAGTSGHAQVPR